MLRLPFAIFRQKVIIVIKINATQLSYSMKQSSCPPFLGLKMAGTFIGNSTAIQVIFRRICEQFGG